MTRAFLSLRSNLGDRLGCLRKATEALGRERKGERAPRTGDVDVLLFGQEDGGKGL